MVTLITDPSFDYNRTEEYKLSIQVSLDGFSFSVVQEKEAKLLAFEHLPITISSASFLGRRFSEWHESRELLQKQYAETQLFYSSENFTLVPAEFYEYEKQEQLAKCNFGSKNEISVRDNYLPDVEANLIFSVPESLLEAFNNLFPGCSVNHPVSLFNQKIQEGYQQEDKERLLALLFHKNTFSLLLYQKGQLTQINSFAYRHPDDVVFYTLSVFKSLHLSASKTPLLLAGTINKENDVVNSLSEYFAKTSFLALPFQYNRDIFGNLLNPFTPLF
ncbi:Protein of unknown function [Mariniphaga anaerophila]|uniref:DUF3822 domain-containing protein n=1 Tax=Mariniphaga anaerophila TaxID=1484053 RepID=A0A1M4SHS9_9BACT|nr:DUF3822 family protein [Mariniphaga anaerophila]SHE31750.1 Protein of unknown function [Mariniphaga anaerophila]